MDILHDITLHPVQITKGETYDDTLTHKKQSPISPSYLNYVETRANNFEEIHCFAMKFDCKNEPQVLYHIGQCASEQLIE